ncbi:poly-beta-1,6 N-acetyl-D-glucosamine export porin PgaA [Paraburkholderia bannensis]|uniref:poly-beta-1,6 N-acetyl-D-glucosamine export porin PgaA n=1 Tax=Paraburkholderia bannensis TaxID=765414 RepID=UPI002AAF9DEF|nr:poly-beta-1,6 N-acetyl-D-glucosamine export porin PgaA [Paraburkholderia bannensis]
MVEFKRMCALPSRRPLSACASACAPAAVVLFSAYAGLESKAALAQGADTGRPVVFMVAMADDPGAPVPRARPVQSSDTSAPPRPDAAPTIYAVVAMQDVPQASVTDTGEAAPAHTVAPPPVHAPVHAPVHTETVAQAAAPSPSELEPQPTAQSAPQSTPESASNSTSGSASNSTPENAKPGDSPTTPGNEPPTVSMPAAPPPDGAPQPSPINPLTPSASASDVPEPNDDVRRRVFALATSGGAVRALDEAKARPDVFTPVDIASIQELDIRQQVRGGRAKVRAMTSADRFDALDSAIHEAEEFDKQLPSTPEYAEVRAALAGDRTVAYAARGRMEDAVAAFETIPPHSAISVEALTGVGDAYSYLQEPAKAEQVFRRAQDQETATTPDTATLGYQYGTHTRLIDVREGLFYSLTDQNKYTQAKQVLDDIHAALPPAAEVHPWDVANDDYLRYYRLLAQYQIYVGQTSTGLAGLQKLEEQVPFSSEVRNAQADATLGMGRTRKARDMYSASLTDHPDNIEALAGLGRSSLALGDYANARQIDGAFDDTFPENGSVRSFKRDFAAYRAPVVTVELNGEHGNSVLADNEFASDTTIYSPPIYDYWRVFSHTFFGYANTDIGNTSRTRTGVGGDYRNGALTLTAEATRSMGGYGRTGGNGEVSYQFNDYLSASAGVDSDSNALPWKAYVEHLWGKSAQASLNFVDGDQRSASLSYAASRYSDSNFNQEIALSGTQRVFTTANQFINVSLNLSTGSNTISNATYYAPGRDYTAEVVAMHQWAIWRSGEKALVQRFYVTAGAYNERGFGTSPEFGARIEHAWTFSHDIALTYGIGVLSHAYDGSREFSETAYATLTVPF